MKKFITYEESLNILNQIQYENKSTQKLFISDCLNRVLAEDIIACENSPAFETSAMDGYAIKYEDLHLQKLKIIDKNPAGTMITTDVTTGNCIKTFTGSLMPTSLSERIVCFPKIFLSKTSGY